MDPAKKIVCITGTLWTGDEDAPRKRLVHEGFVRPVWFTTSRGITDAEYGRITDAQYHLALSRHEVLVHTGYGAGHMGIMKTAFDAALAESKRGVLVVGPPAIAAQLANLYPHAVLFALKCAGMQLSEELAVAGLSHRVHRIDVNSWQPGAWTHAFEEMMRVLGVSIG